MNEMVGIVIVSHSTTSPRAPPTWCGRWSAARSRSPCAAAIPTAGWAPTSTAIIDAIDDAWSPKGVAILVDLGGAETNSEMAVEMLRAGAARAASSSATRRSSRAR